MPATLVHGVVTRRFDILLHGEGRVFGVKFRPGGFAAFTGTGVSAYTDRAIHLSDVPAAHHAAVAGRDLQDAILATDDDARRAALMDAYLLSGRPAPDPRYEQLLTVVADMLAARDLTSVRAVAERHSIEPRTLQRLFRHYVGVGPKWVLRRFRLHDAQLMIEAAEETGDRINLADLATRLGWFDQAHFTRDFRAAVGVPPSAYHR
jgi:transcriptional regulator GlxA family with amidase domain